MSKHEQASVKGEGLVGGLHGGPIPVPALWVSRMQTQMQTQLPGPGTIVTKARVVANQANPPFLKLHRLPSTCSSLDVPVVGRQSSLTDTHLASAHGTGA